MRVLIIRPSALGDVCRTVPALATLRNALPDAHIDWLVHEAFVDAISAHPDLNGVIPFARKRFAGMLTRPKVFREFRRFCKELKQNQYDLVVDLQGLFRSGFLTHATRAGRRLGFANARELAWLGYNRRYTVDHRVHTVERMLALLEMDGFEPVRDARLYVTPHDQKWLKVYLHTRSWDEQRYACIAPTAQWKCKCWPIAKFTELAKRLADEPRVGGRVVVLAAPHERAMVQPMIDALSGKVTIDWPKTTVGQMMALISKASLVVCNDSGPLHAAVGFNRPIVTFFGPTLVEQVGPYLRHDSVVVVPGVDETIARSFRRNKDDQSLIDEIEVDTAWAKVQEQLDRAE